MQRSRRTKTADIMKDDITSAARCQHVTVLQSNIIFVIFAVLVLRLCCCRPNKVL